MGNLPDGFDALLCTPGPFAFLRVLDFLLLCDVKHGKQLIIFSELSQMKRKIAKKISQKRVLLVTKNMALLVSGKRSPSSLCILSKLKKTYYLRVPQNAIEGPRRWGSAFGIKRENNKILTRKSFFSLYFYFYFLFLGCVYLGSTKRNERLFVRLLRRKMREIEWTFWKVSL